MISTMMNVTYGTNDHTPVGLCAFNHTPRATHGANDLRTFGARSL